MSYLFCADMRHIMLAAAGFAGSDVNILFGVMLPLQVPIGFAAVIHARPVRCRPFGVELSHAISSSSRNRLPHSKFSLLPSERLRVSEYPGKKYSPLHKSQRARLRQLALRTSFRGELLRTSGMVSRRPQLWMRVPFVGP